MKNNISTGNTGEYFVAGELERRGYTVAVPMSNTKDFDILAIHRETYNQYAIQVKTTIYNTKKWILGIKNEKLIGINIIYVFVVLNGLNTPQYYVVPSKVVADYIVNSHKEWLNMLGKKGNKHNDNPMRQFSVKNDEYLNRWDLLK